MISGGVLLYSFSYLNQNLTREVGCSVNNSLKLNNFQMVMWVLFGNTDKLLFCHLGGRTCRVKELSCFLQCDFSHICLHIGFLCSKFFTQFLANIFALYLHPYPSSTDPVLSFNPGSSLSHFHFCLHPRRMASAARPP